MNDNPAQNDPTLAIAHEPVKEDKPKETVITKGQGWEILSGASDVFAQTIHNVDKMTADERITLIKYISYSMGGPRFYTGTEVEDIVSKFISKLTGTQLKATLVDVLGPTGGAHAS